MHRELGDARRLKRSLTAGDVIRIQPNHICFNTVEAYEDIYGKHSKAVKGEFYTILGSRPGRPASIFTEQFTVLYNESDGSDATRHGFLRRVMNPSFAPAALKSLEPTVDRYVNKLLVGVEQKALQSEDIVEINKWFHNLAFDVHSLVIVVDCRLRGCWLWAWNSTVLMVESIIGSSKGSIRILSS